MGLHVTPADGFQHVAVVLRPEPAVVFDGVQQVFVGVRRRVRTAVSVEHAEEKEMHVGLVGRSHVRHRGQVLHVRPAALVQAAGDAQADAGGGQRRKGGHCPDAPSEKMAPRERVWCPTRMPGTRDKQQPTTGTYNDGQTVYNI